MAQANGLRELLCSSVDVPCRVLLSGLQVARVIGKNGVLIKELREESAAVVNILDKQLPVAFSNRDERVVLIRGSLQQIGIAMSGILRLAFGGNAAEKGEVVGDHRRAVEVMIPESSCSHLIGEKGGRIGALMDETKCDLHIVREPVSGLLEQRRLRITGPTLRDVEFGCSKVQELLTDLTKFGCLQDSHFDIREGPTAAADLVPRDRGRASGVSVAVLLPKDEVAWVIGKRGSKISRLRERARVGVNDADTPPFPQNHVVIEINGAPLGELVHVLQLIIDDLALRQDASNTTQLLLPTDYFGAAIGRGGDVIARISEQTGAQLSQYPVQRHGAMMHPRRIIEVSGSERERVAAAAELYGAVEAAMDGGTSALQLPHEAMHTDPLKETHEPAYEPAHEPAPESALVEAGTSPQARVLQARAHPGQDPVLTVSEAGMPSSSASHGSEVDFKVSFEARANTHVHQVFQQSREEGCMQKVGFSNVLATTEAEPKSQSATPSCRSSTFLLLPDVGTLRFVVSERLGIARRSGAELVAGHGPGGEAILKIVGLPGTSATACYLIQEALWLQHAHRPCV